MVTDSFKSSRIRRSDEGREPQRQNQQSVVPEPPTTHPTAIELVNTSSEEDNGLEEGMLLRDVPQRTTFYDPVAERQMSQTDAKLFYQRSKIDVRAQESGTGWSLSSPNGSPIMASGSRPLTEYGADSLILEQDGGKSNMLIGLTHVYLGD